MQFSDNKPIYLQIADLIMDRILREDLAVGERIPSVREYAVDIGVNPNTLMHTYELLSKEGIIYSKRGLGYYVTEDARDIILGLGRKLFFENELPRLLERMRLLEIPQGQVLDAITSPATPPWVPTGTATEEGFR